MAYFRCGGGGVPASVKTDMNAVLNKKFGTSTDYPPADWAPTVNLMGPLPEKTQASASVCAFEDGADDVPTKSLVVNIPPTLSGVSSLTETQTERNLLNASDNSYTFNVGDNYRYNCGTVSLKKGITYTFSALQEDALTSNTRNTLVIGVNENYTYEYATGTNYHNQSGVHSMQYTPSEDCEAVFLVWVHTPSNAVTYSDFMLEIGSTAHAYEQYQTPTTYTASLGRTIYGGTADIVTGEGKETHAEILLNEDNKDSWLYNSQFAVFSFTLTSGSYKKELGNTDMACDSDGLTVIGQVNAFSDMANKPDNTITLMSIDNDSYWRIFVKKTSLTSVDDMKTWITSNPITFVYPVGTPTDFTFDGQEIPTKLGYNAFWSDSGDTEVTYRADIDLLLGGN